MAGHVLWIGEKHNPFSVRRWMREPIVIIVSRDLLLIGAVRLHPPDLHRTAAFGIEINIFAIGGIVRSVVETFGRRQPLFLTVSIGIGCLDIKFPISLRTIRERLAVR